MDIPRTENDLLQMIANKVEESLSLDYKRAEALTQVKGKGDLTKEVTKDVSAFANSAGGMIIYGISEGSEATKHLPVALSPIDRTLFSKERLEHLINNIQPKIPSIEIVPIELTTGECEVVYVVVIPPSTTAHQCTDKRYYRRHNFEAVMMEDYEIRDVMNRNRHPILTLEVVLRLMYSKRESAIGGMPSFMGNRSQLEQNFWWLLSVKNNGGAIAHYVEGTVEFPTSMLLDYRASKTENVELNITNFLRTTYGTGLYSKSSEPEYKRILPGCSLEVISEMASLECLGINKKPFTVQWNIFCDNAPSQAGVVQSSDVIVEINSAFEEELARKSVNIDQFMFTTVKRI